MAVTGVSAEWVNENFTSLKLAILEEGTYRISYSAVNKTIGNCSIGPKLTVPTDSASVKIIASLNPDCFYDVFVEIVLSQPRNVVNESVGIGENFNFIRLVSLSYCIKSR